MRLLDTFFTSNESPYRKDVSKGWVCPKCGTVYAPTVITCVPCTQKQKAFRVANQEEDE